jgi:nucleotide-binding universal stress UspA family protein
MLPTWIIQKVAFEESNMIGKILVAVDGSTQAGKALDLAIDMAKAFAAELTVLHIISEQALTEGERRLAGSEYQAEVLQAVGGSQFTAPLGSAPMSVEDLVGASYSVGVAIRTAIGRAIVDRAETDARSQRVTSVKTVLRDGDPASVIIEVANDEKPDLLVMGSRGLGGMQRLLLGSVSQKVSHSAGCTVTIVK